jgi:hypothetical protein
MIVTGTDVEIKAYVKFKNLKESNDFFKFMSKTKNSDGVKYMIVYDENDSIILHRSVYATITFNSIYTYNRFKKFVKNTDSTIW